MDLLEVIIKPYYKLEPEVRLTPEQKFRIEVDNAISNEIYRLKLVNEFLRLWIDNTPKTFKAKA